MFAPLYNPDIVNSLCLLLLSVMYHNNHALSNHTNHMQQCVVCVAGAGAAPQIGGKLAAGPWVSSALDASAAAAAP